jgi:hypothetical protein
LPSAACSRSVGTITSQSLSLVNASLTSTSLILTITGYSHVRRI